MKWRRLKDNLPSQETCLALSTEGDLFYIRWNGQLYQIIPLSRTYCCGWDTSDDKDNYYPYCGYCAKSMWLYLNDPNWQKFTHWMHIPELPVVYQDPPSTDCCESGCAKEQEEREREEDEQYERENNGSN